MLGLVDADMESKRALADEVRRRLRLARLYHWSMSISPWSGEDFDVLLVASSDGPPTDEDQITNACPNIRIKICHGRWQREEAHPWVVHRCFHSGLGRWRTRQASRTGTHPKRQLR